MEDKSWMYTQRESNVLGEDYFEHQGCHLANKKNMKLFYIELNEWGYDDYDSCVLAAESLEQVKEFCAKRFWNIDENGIWSPCCDGDKEFNIHTGQMIERIEEIGTTDKYTVPTIICSSFNAG